MTDPIRQSCIMSAEESSETMNVMQRLKSKGSMRANAYPHPATELRP
jgi:hypothetical protein